MQNKSLITGVALSAIAIVGIVTAVNVSNMQKASSTAAVVKSQSQVASDLIINSITQEQLQKIDADRATLLTTLKPLNYTFKTNITATSPSSEIKKMQEVLRDNMYYSGDLTGKMDNITTTALMELQSENELPQSSTAGPKTREVLTRLAGSVGPCQGTLQSVRLKKPNGGEIYQDGQQVSVSWRSCNIPSTYAMAINLVLYNTNNTPLGTISSSSFSTLNSGSKTIVLPSMRSIHQANPVFSGVSFGQHFKILISAIGAPSYDYSDNFFSIELPVAITADFPTMGAVITSSIYSGMQIARFKVTNNSSVPVTLTAMRLTDTGSHGGTSSTYWLYASDDNMNNYTANQIGGRLNSFDFTPLASYPVVHPGSYRYITVAINNTSGIQSGNTFSLGVHTNGDVTYYAREQDLGYDTNGDGDIIDSVYNLRTIGNPQLGTVQIN